MKIEYISQPFPPEEQWLGSQLRSLLTGREGRFDKFIASVAFIKFSGISRIYDALKEFRDSGGSASVIAGIDHRGTSKQGLEYLKGVVDHVFIYHDDSPERRTFHPKIYVFEQTDQRAVVILGSGNLTAGGLFTNYEAHIRIDLTLTSGTENDEDRNFFAKVIASLETFQDATSECVQELTDEILTLLEAELPDEAPSEASSATSDGTEDEASEPTAPPPKPSSGLFGRSHLPRAPKPDISLGGRGRAPKSAASTSASPALPLPLPATPTSTASPGFWKVLSGNDVSTTSSPGQIIIPIRFRDFFEPLKLTKPPDAGGKGRQWESEYPGLFRDGSLTRTINARCIVYEPETGHPRTNTECRFTFRNRGILERLRAGDILAFRRAADGSLQVERITATDSRYGTLYRGTGARYGTLS